MRFVQNPTTEEFKKGVYKPRLTVTRRMGTGSAMTTLRIEFSIPKLIFGNNFDEVDDTHFDEVISRLYRIIFDMGDY